MAFAYNIYWVCHQGPGVHTVYIISPTCSASLISLRKCFMSQGKDHDPTTDAGKRHGSQQENVESRRTVASISSMMASAAQGLIMSSSTFMRVRGQVYPAFSVAGANVASSSSCSTSSMRTKGGLAMPQLGLVDYCKVSKQGPGTCFRTMWKQKEKH